MTEASAQSFRPAQPYPSGPAARSLTGAQERTWATVAHLSVPVVGVVGPLAIWLACRKRSRFVTEHALEALNWSIVVTLAVVVSSLLTVVAVGVLALPLIGVVAVAAAIGAALAAHRGETYRYRLNWRIVK